MEISQMAQHLSQIRETSVSDGLFEFIADIIENHGKAGKRWSSTTSTLFAIVRDYGGKRAAHELTKFLSGPSISTMYRKARSE